MSPQTVQADMLTIRLLLCAAYVAAFAAMGVQVGYATPSLLSVGYSAATLGSLWGVRSLGTAFAPAFFGALSDRTNMRFGVAVFCLAVAAFAFSSVAFVRQGLSPWFGFVLYGFVGSASVAMLDGLALRFLKSDVSGYAKIRVFGSVGFGLSAVLASAFFKYSETGFTPERVFGFSGAAVFVAALCVFFLGRYSDDEKVELNKKGSSIFLNFRRPFVLKLSFVGLLHWASFGVYTAFLQPALARIGGDSMSVGFAVACAIVSEIVALMVVKKAIEKYGEWPILVMALFFSSLRWFLLSQCESVWLFVALQLLNGISFGFFYSAAVSAIARRTEQALKQSAQGFFFSSYFGIGGLVGTFCAGQIVEVYSAKEALMVMGALSAFALVVFCLAIRRSGEA